MSLIPPTEPAAPPVAGPRVPIKAQVRIKFKDLAGFVNAHAANISRAGMFILTQQPRPAGTFLRFELGLSDDFALIKGVGQVAWIRWDDESAERPAGMGIRFRSIDRENRETVSRVVDRQIQSGCEPLRN